MLTRVCATGQSQGQLSPPLSFETVSCVITGLQVPRDSLGLHLAEGVLGWQTQVSRAIFYVDSGDSKPTFHAFVVVFCLLAHPRPHTRSWREVLPFSTYTLTFCHRSQGKWRRNRQTSLFTATNSTDPLPAPASSLTVPCPTQPHPKPHLLGSLYGSGSYKSPASELGRRVGADDGPGRCLFTFSVFRAGVAEGG